MTLKARYVISGIEDVDELMTLSGTLAGWMLLHPNTNLDEYEDVDEP